VRDFGAKHGLAKEAQAINWVDDQLVVSDAAERARILDLRRDPHLSTILAGEMLSRDRARIARRIGRDLTQGETYLAHFLGPDDAERFLEKVVGEPNANASKLLPKPRAANKPIFFARKGRKAKSLSVAEVHRKFEAMMDCVSSAIATCSRRSRRGRSSKPACADRLAPRSAPRAKIATAAAEDRVGGGCDPDLPRRRLISLRCATERQRIAMLKPALLAALIGSVALQAALANEAKPAGAEASPASVQAKVASETAKPAAVEAKSKGGKAKAPSGEAKRAGGKASAAAAEAKPAVARRAPSCRGGTERRKAKFPSVQAKRTGSKAAQRPRPSRRW
jgi:hypothetical protein